MKPIAWYDPSNGMVSTDQDCSLFTPLGQVWPLYAKEEPKDEPVAWISPTELLVMRGNALAGAKDWRVNVGLKPEDGDVGLYTTPQRTWVGLTKEERHEISMANRPYCADIMAAHEEELKRRNT
jgi:hypothetical protein